MWIYVNTAQDFMMKSEEFNFNKNTTHTKHWSPAEMTQRDVIGNYITALVSNVNFFFKLLK